MKNLVIVESPNKVATIKKYLGNEFEVVASVGHFLKMKTDGQFGLGIDFENWEPRYSLDTSKRKVVKEIKEALKDIDKVYIATDLTVKVKESDNTLLNILKSKTILELDITKLQRMQL
nr:toprim domain-containing protein [Mycoplasmopsis cynos]